MKALRIDPSPCLITEETYNANPWDIRWLCRFDSFVSISLPSGDMLFVRTIESFDQFRHFFSVSGILSYFAGYGIVVGIDADGVRADPKITLDELKHLVSFWFRMDDDTLHRVYPGPNGTPRRGRIFVR